MRTPLYEAHVALGAKMVDFAGWEMPLQYAGILEEHRAVRTAAGLFDVSHMGELWLEGDGAYSFLQRLLTHDLRRLLEGKWAYSPMCYPDGGTVDDVIVYPRPGGFLVCVNASNTEKDYRWIASQAPRGVSVENRSSLFAQLAVQGPLAAEIVARTDLSRVLLKSPTGYTGEKGCELYVAPEHVRPLWDDLVAAGARPCGLGARDTLRTEAALPLYGHEISETISPYEAGLHRFICFDKGDFIGREALLARKNDPGARRLVGLWLEGRAIPRPGYEVVGDGSVVGAVTSGGPAPALGGQIAMALVAGEARNWAVRIRKKDEPARLTALPFYRRG